MEENVGKIIDTGFR